MKKNLYVSPKVEIAKLCVEELMIVASPGVGGDYDPDIPIDAKENHFYDNIYPDYGKKYGLWED